MMLPVHKTSPVFRDAMVAAAPVAVPPPPSAPLVFAAAVATPLFSRAKLIRPNFESVRPAASAFPTGRGTGRSRRAIGTAVMESIKGLATLALGRDSRISVKT